MNFSEKISAAILLFMSKTGGVLEVRKGETLILRTIDRKPLSIRYIKFGSFEKANLEYFYDCHGDDIDIDTSTNKMIKTNQGIADAMIDRHNSMVVHTTAAFSRGNDRHMTTCCTLTMTISIFVLNLYYIFYLSY